MCDMCDNQFDDNPVSAPPLQKQDYIQAFLILFYNITISFTTFFTDLIQMLRYQSRFEAKRNADWASIAADLEKLEADNG